MLLFSIFIIVMLYFLTFEPKTHFVGNFLSGLSSGQLCLLAVIVLFGCLFFLLDFTPGDFRRIKEMQRAEKEEVARRCKKILRKPDKLEQELLNEAVPEIKDGLWKASIVFGFFTASFGYATWVLWCESSKHWLVLIIFFGPLFFLWLFVYSLLADIKVRRCIKQIQEGDYLVAQGTSLRCSPGRWNCYVYGFIGSPPSKRKGLSYDDFAESVVFTKNDMPHEFIAIQWHRRFLYVNFGDIGFAVAKLPNGKILANTNVRLGRHEDYVGCSKDYLEGH